MQVGIGREVDLRSREAKTWMGPRMFGKKSCWGGGGSQSLVTRQTMAIDLTFQPPTTPFSTYLGT